MNAAPVHPVSLPRHQLPWRSCHAPFLPFPSLRPAYFCDTSTWETGAEAPEACMPVFAPRPRHELILFFVLAQPTPAFPRAALSQHQLILHTASQNIHASHTNHRLLPPTPHLYHAPSHASPIPDKQPNRGLHSIHHHSTFRRETRPRPKCRLLRTPSRPTAPTWATPSTSSTSAMSPALARTESRRPRLTRNMPRHS